jgi:hypothetical protein
MPKMHEIIAVSDDLKGQATKTRTDLISTFTSKPHHFGKKIVTFRPDAEGLSPTTEEQSEIQTTLIKEIAWVSGFLTKAIDNGYQVDLGNLQAKADLVVEGQDGKPIVFAKDVPATFLMQLGRHLQAVRDLANTIPTLDPVKGFTRDDKQEKGIYVAREVIKPRTKKVKKVLVLTPSTDKHPAQVQSYDDDEKIGTTLTQEWSSLATPGVKSQILARADSLIQATKKALSRANSLELDVTAQKVGKQLLDYVFAPLEQ